MLKRQTIPIGLNGSRNHDLVSLSAASTFFIAPSHKFAKMPELLLLQPKLQLENLIDEMIPSGLQLLTDRAMIFGVSAFGSCLQVDWSTCWIRRCCKNFLQCFQGYVQAFKYSC